MSENKKTITSEHRATPEKQQADLKLLQQQFEGQDLSKFPVIQVVHNIVENKKKEGEKS